VNSQVYDHSLVIQLVGKRFGIWNPIFSPWRRMIIGDLLSVFDFNTPDYSWPSLPDTSGNVQKAKTECSTLPDPTIPLFKLYQLKNKEPNDLVPYHINL